MESAIQDDSNSLQQQNNLQAQHLWATYKQQGEAALAALSSEMRYADLAIALEPLKKKQRRKIFAALPPRIAAEILEESNPQLRDELLLKCDDNVLLKIFTQAATDDAVAFLDRFPEARVEQLLHLLDDQVSERLSEQYEFPEDVAGRHMVRRLVALPPFMNAGQAIQKIKETQIETGAAAVYIIETTGKLLGVIGFRALVFADNATPLKSLMTTDGLITVNLHDDREDAANLMQRYHITSLPVVDDNYVLRGVITWDDAVDIIEKEAEEDILAVAGTTESIEDNESILKRVSHRLPYLLITTVGGFIMAGIIDAQIKYIESYAILISFIPLVPALAANVGIQCSTVTLRSLSDGPISAERLRQRTMREISTGFVLAICLAIICGAGAAIMVINSDGLLFLAGIITLSLLIAVSIAACFGVIIPLACDRFGIDPAIAAGPFIMMLNDIAGVGIYLMTAIYLINIFAGN